MACLQHANLPATSCRHLLHRRRCCFTVCSRTLGSSSRGVQRNRVVLSVHAMWTRPGQDQGDFIKPSYVPQPSRAPEFEPDRQRDDQPLYQPMGVPEFRPAEQPERFKENQLPEAPPVPARPRDPLPAGRPKERPPGEDGDEKPREAPPPEKSDPAPSKN